MILSIRWTEWVALELSIVLVDLQAGAVGPSTCCQGVRVILNSEKPDPQEPEHHGFERSAVSCCVFR